MSNTHYMHLMRFLFSPAASLKEARLIFWQERAPSQSGSTSEISPDTTNETEKMLREHKALSKSIDQLKDKAKNLSDDKKTELLSYIRELGEIESKADPPLFSKEGGKKTFIADARNEHAKEYMDKFRGFEAALKAAVAAEQAKEGAGSPKNPITTPSDPPLGERPERSTDSTSETSSDQISRLKQFCTEQYGIVTSSDFSITDRYFKQTRSAAVALGVHSKLLTTAKPLRIHFSHEDKVVESAPNGPMIKVDVMNPATQEAMNNRIKMLLEEFISKFRSENAPPNSPPNSPPTSVDENERVIQTRAALQALRKQYGFTITLHDDLDDDFYRNRMVLQEALTFHAGKIKMIRDSDGLVLGREFNVIKSEQGQFFIELNVRETNQDVMNQELGEVIDEYITSMQIEQKKRDAMSELKKMENELLEMAKKIEEKQGLLQERLRVLTKDVEDRVEDEGTPEAIYNNVYDFSVLGRIEKRIRGAEPGLTSADVMDRRVELLQKTEKEIAELMDGYQSKAYEFSLFRFTIMRSDLDALYADKMIPEADSALLRLWAEFGTDFLRQMDTDLLTRARYVFTDSGSLLSKHLEADVVARLQTLEDQLSSREKLTLEFKQTTSPVIQPSLRDILASTAPDGRTIDTSRALPFDVRRAKEALISASTHEMSDIIEQWEQGGVRVETFDHPWNFDKAAAEEGGKYVFANLILPSGRTVRGVRMTKNAFDLVRGARPKEYPYALRKQNSELHDVVLSRKDNLYKTSYEPSKFVTLGIDDFQAIDAKEIPVEKKKIAEKSNEKESAARSMLTAIEGTPELVSVCQTTQVLGQRFGTLQSIVAAGMKGWKSQGFVEYGLLHARALRDDLDRAEQEGIGSKLSYAISLLQDLRDSLGHGFTDLERQIASRIDSLQQFQAFWKSDERQYLIDTVLDISKWNEDTWWNFIKTEGPRILSSIIVATALALAVGAAIGTGGTLSPLALTAVKIAATSFATTAGGMIGYGVMREGQWAYHNWTQNLGDRTYTDRSLPMQLFSGQRVYDEVTKKYLDMELYRDVVRPLAQEFGCNLFFTGLAIGASSISSFGLARLLQSAKLQSWRIAPMIQKLSFVRLNAAKLTTAQKDSLKKAFQNFLKEIGEEVQEEAEETAFGKALDGLENSLTQAEMSYGLGDAASLLLGTFRGVLRKRGRVLTYNVDTTTADAKFNAVIATLPQGCIVTPLGKGQVGTVPFIIATPSGLRLRVEPNVQSTPQSQTPAQVQAQPSVKPASTPAPTPSPTPLPAQTSTDVLSTESGQEQGLNMRDVHELMPVWMKDPTFHRESAEGYMWDVFDALRAQYRLCQTEAHHEELYRIWQGRVTGPHADSIMQCVDAFYQCSAELGAKPSISFESDALNTALRTHWQVDIATLSQEQIVRHIRALSAASLTVKQVARKEILPQSAIKALQDLQEVYPDSSDAIDATIKACQDPSLVGTFEDHTLYNIGSETAGGRVTVQRMRREVKDPSLLFSGDDDPWKAFDAKITLRLLQLNNAIDSLSDAEKALYPNLEKELRTLKYKYGIVILQSVSDEYKLKAYTINGRTVTIGELVDAVRSGCVSHEKAMEVVDARISQLDDGSQAVEKKFLQKYRDHISKIKRGIFAKGRALLSQHDVRCIMPDQSGEASRGEDSEANPNDVSRKIELGQLKQLHDAFVRLNNRTDLQSLGIDNDSVREAIESGNENQLKEYIREFMSDFARLMKINPSVVSHDEFTAFADKFNKVMQPYGLEMKLEKTPLRIDASDIPQYKNEGYDTSYASGEGTIIVISTRIVFCDGQFNNSYPITLSIPDMFDLLDIDWDKIYKVSTPSQTGGTATVNTPQPNLPSSDPRSGDENSEGESQSEPPPVDKELPDSNDSEEEGELDNDSDFRLGGGYADTDDGSGSNESFNSFLAVDPDLEGGLSDDSRLRLSADTGPLDLDDSSSNPQFIMMDLISFGVLETACGSKFSVQLNDLKSALANYEFGDIHQSAEVFVKAVADSMIAEKDALTQASYIEIEQAFNTLMSKYGYTMSLVPSTCNTVKALQEWEKDVDIIDVNRDCINADKSQNKLYITIQRSTPRLVRADDAGRSPVTVVRPRVWVIGENWNW